MTGTWSSRAWPISPWTEHKPVTDEQSEQLKTLFGLPEKPK